MATDLSVFILTHGRPNKVKTYKTLRKHGYTGKIYLIVDNEDESVEEYQKKFEDVIVFDKKDIIFDVGDNFNERRGVVYARNACFDIAKSLGITYFIQLDDDYSHFSYKFTKTLEYKERMAFSLDKLFILLLDYYKSIDALTLAIAQNGDFIGGSASGFASELKMKRKAMNTHICSTERPYQFVGRINEDVNTPIVLGSRGYLFLTIPNVSISQMTTQKNSGGLTEQYLDTGTYVKSFYSVMFNPSCVKVHEMGDKHKRLHHKVKWNNAVPVIVSEDYRRF